MSNEDVQHSEKYSQDQVKHHALDSWILIYHDNYAIVFQAPCGKELLSRFAGIWYIWYFEN